MDKPAYSCISQRQRFLSKIVRSISTAARQLRRVKFRRWLALAMIIVLVQGCTNSKIIIGPLYNRLDDRMRGEFDKLGEFTEKQRADFEASLGTFHVWHRQAELPQYADLLQNVAASITQESTTAQDVTRWFDAAELHSKAARECHPINFLIGMIKTLPEKQLTFIENRFKREQAKNLARYESRTPEERIERRVRNMVKWASRVGLDFTPTQRAMFLSAFKRQISLRTQYYELSGEWNRTFFDLARNKLNSDYERDLHAHLAKLWRLLESEYPQQWQENRTLWKETALRFAKSMTAEQRDTMSRWMNKMGETLVGISKDEPSFKVANNPSVGCLVDPERT